MALWPSANFDSPLSTLKVPCLGGNHTASIQPQLWPRELRMCSSILYSSGRACRVQKTKAKFSRFCEILNNHYDYADICVQRNCKAYHAGCSRNTTPCLAVYHKVHHFQFLPTSNEEGWQSVRFLADAE